MDTDNGRPSGIATAKTVIPIIMYLRISFQSLLLSQSPWIPFFIANLIISTKNISMAEYKPNFPISSAIIYNFSYNGVSKLIIYFYIHHPPIQGLL